MRDSYQKKLKQLSDEVAEMGMFCELAIMKTYQLLVADEEKETLIDEINRLEKEIDAKEGAVESVSMQLLLKQQPVAGDLRRISASLKLVTDLERIGDQATDIAEIMNTGSIKTPVEQQELLDMAKFTMQMVNSCVQAYTGQDAQLAEEVIDSDDILDEMFLKIRKILNENLTCRSSDQILDLLMIAKYYERIGDHATNVAEWVEFSANGMHRNGDAVYDIFGTGRPEKI